MWLRLNISINNLNIQITRRINESSPLRQKHPRILRVGCTLNVPTAVSEMRKCGLKMEKVIRREMLSAAFIIKIYLIAMHVCA